MQASFGKPHAMPASRVAFSFKSAYFYSRQTSVIWQYSIFQRIIIAAGLVIWHFCANISNTLSHKVRHDNFQIN
jgi:hypothetical protein